MRKHIEEQFWRLVERAGAETVLRMLIDELPASKLKKIADSLAYQMRDPYSEAKAMLVKVGRTQAQAEVLIEQVRQTCPPQTSEVLVFQKAMRLDMASKAN